MYEQVKKSAGNRCLVILEGLDEMAAEHQKSDPFLVRVGGSHDKKSESLWRIHFPIYPLRNFCCS